MAKKFGQVLFTLLIAGGLFISACSPVPMIEKEIENTPEPEPTATLVVSAEIEEIIDDPIPAIDFSDGIVTVGGLECTLESYGDDYLGLYTLACPEQLWLPMGQTAPIKLNLLDSETCTISPIDDFKIAIQDLSIDAMPVDFVQIEDAQWGCQIPYSDTAGVEVVCGFECVSENWEANIGIIIIGKTIRVYLGDNGGEGRNDGGQPPSPSSQGPPGSDPDG